MTSVQWNSTIGTLCDSYASCNNVQTLQDIFSLHLDTRLDCT